MNIENYFEQEKGITVDAARNAGAKYTAIDICRFAKKYHESEVKNLSSNTMLSDSKTILHRCSCEEGNPVEVKICLNCDGILE